MNAIDLASFPSEGATSPHGILRVREWRQVSRFDAPPMWARLKEVTDRWVMAEVLDGQAFGNWSYEVFVRPAVDVEGPATRLVDRVA